MPWHDVHSRIIGAAVANISKHFIQRWNLANYVENHINLSSIKNESIIQNNTFNFSQKFTKNNTLKDKNIEAAILIMEKIILNLRI